jgi:hypothetical protein
MMYQVRIDCPDFTQPGIAVAIPVKVVWPELKLLPYQEDANAIARLCHQKEPFSDNSIFEVVVRKSEHIIQLLKRIEELEDEVRMWEDRDYEERVGDDD